MSSYDIFVLLHNHAKTLAATLEGVLVQHPGPGKVFVVNNASTDSWQTICDDYSRRIAIEVIDNLSNKGFSRAANQAIGLSTTPWILSLNPDCRLTPCFVSTLLATLDDHPRAGSASGLLLRAEGCSLQPSEIVDSAGMIVTSSGRHFDRGAGRPLAAKHVNPAWVFGATGAAALYRRQALDDVVYEGGEFFDERFFAYREDADLAWRLQRRGWGCLFVPSAKAFHGRGLRPEKKRKGTSEINRLSVRNRFLLRMSNADWRWNVACFPTWLIRDFIVVLGCLIKERASLSGLGEAWQMREDQRDRGRINSSRALTSGWQVARWFLPGGHVRRVLS